MPPIVGILPLHHVPTCELLEWLVIQQHLYERIFCYQEHGDVDTQNIIASIFPNVEFIPLPPASTVTRSDVLNSLSQKVRDYFGLSTWIMLCDINNYFWSNTNEPWFISAHSDIDHFQCDIIDFSFLCQPIDIVFSQSREPFAATMPIWNMHFDDITQTKQTRIYRATKEICWNETTLQGLRHCSEHNPKVFHKKSGNTLSTSDSNQLPRIRQHALPIELLFGSIRRTEGQLCVSNALRSTLDCHADFEMISQFIEDGRFDEASSLLLSVCRLPLMRQERSKAASLLGILPAAMNHATSAIQYQTAALAIDCDNKAAQKNHTILCRRHLSEDFPRSGRPRASLPSSNRRIAIVSFLFNWPSTGGGTIHTKELCEQLQNIGYDVLHVFPKYEPWSIGRQDGSLRVPTACLPFNMSNWTLPAILQAYKYAIKSFDPSAVIITDSWNIKPWLASAVREFPYILRYQALETLCPLNNIRLLPNNSNQPAQCNFHQLSNPTTCTECCNRNGEFSGELHRRERQLSMVGTYEYQQTLRRSLQEAKATMVVNDLTYAMISPYAKRVIVAPSGIDPKRFDRPDTLSVQDRSANPRILFAGLTDEYMKGFHILLEAAQLLADRCLSFEIVVTGNPFPNAPKYIHFVGWLDQEKLAAMMHASHILVFPTIAQEALGRTAVEAMAAGLPVVASRIGGLLFTVEHGHTGLHVAPGDPLDLANKLEQLLRSPELRRTLGANGRKRFAEKYAWPAIIETHYRSLLDSIAGNETMGMDRA